MEEKLSDPTDNEMLTLVGPRAPLLKDLFAFLRRSYHPTEVYKYSKKNGWTLFFRKGGKPLCYINLRKGGFTVTVVIGVSLVDRMTDSGVSAETMNMFSNSKQFYDGKWLFFDVTQNDQVEDLKRLLLIKKNPVRK